MTILENNAEVIVTAREGIASELPSLWLKLSPLFDPEEQTESSTWCSYDNEGGKLLLTSTINLKVIDEEKTKSLTSIKKILSETDINGLLWSSPLNTYSVLIFSHFFETYSTHVELFTHADIPYLFIRLYIYLNLNISKLDEQAVSNSYFNFICKHGLISMNNGIVQIDTGEVVEKGNKTPELYKGLYNE
jgi:hypothetical protein